ncbi:sporulation transcription factor Spo0A [Planococcus salinarum]|uniref:sporulation transcription factor Spo0A n=1 Tax=Planococcus salinarum TaxID=622695 RepID=UPI000E3CE9AF|nr:sporulation transcription factor Spo0A [Planococcus salinarum]TAA70691.1 sporulation transcription factor Spo0A [Planococcus salinarum]
MEKITIGIADDNRQLADMMEEYLNLQPNMEVVAVAHNGRECIELLKKNKVDILLLDNIMPFLDGIGVLDAIKNEEGLQNLRVIMLSAFGQETLMSQAAQNGASYFIMKPFELDRLAMQIEHIMQEQAASQEVKDDPITAVIKEIGVPPHINGYVYLKEAVNLVLEEPGIIQKVTKSLYPGIADRFDTTPTRVERSIRHAIELVWNRGDVKVIAQTFGYSEEHLRSRPSNSEFIAMVYDTVSRNMEKEKNEAE